MRMWVTMGMIAGLACFAGVAGAGEGQGKHGRRGERSDRAGDRQGRRLEKLDADRDGRISRSEFLAEEGWVGKLDRNRDGSITRDEVSAIERGEDARANRALVRGGGCRPRREGQRESERSASRAKRFQRLDSNQDGYLSEDERPTRSLHPTAGEGSGKGTQG